MPSGGHARSGPVPREGSARSDARGIKLALLPAEGFSGEVPEWPLEPRATRVERAYWERAWRTPQAVLWARQEWAWLVPDVARWVRLTVRCDEPDAPASLLARLPSVEDKIGMTTAGLARMGAKVAADQVADKRVEQAVGPVRASSRSRLKVAGG